MRGANQKTVRKAVSEMLLEYMRDVTTDQEVITSAASELLWEKFKFEPKEAQQTAKLLVDEMYAEAKATVDMESEEAEAYEQERREAAMGRY